MSSLELLPRRQWVPIATAKYYGGAFGGIRFRRLPDAPLSLEDARHFYRHGVLLMAQRRLGPKEDMKHEQLVYRL